MQNQTKAGLTISAVLMALALAVLSCQSAEKLGERFRSSGGPCRDTAYIQGECGLQEIHVHTTDFGEIRQGSAQLDLTGCPQLKL